MTREELIKGYMNDRDYYLGEVKNHEEMDTQDFSLEQKIVYQSNLRRFTRKLEVIKATLEFLGMEVE